MEGYKHLVKIWWSGIKKMPEKTSLHGFRFITDSKKHWTERICWLIFVILSWYGSSQLIAAQYSAFQNNPISVVVETTYKDWNTDFLTIVVCENDNTRRIEEVSDALWGEDHDFNMDEVLKELAYFKGVTYYSSQFCGPSVEDAPKTCIRSNLSYYANMVRSSCKDTLATCSWNNIPFECCEFFRPIDTELGTCYAINSIQGREEHPPKLPMVSNRTTGPGAIQFDMLVPGIVFAFNKEEVPTLNTLGSDFLTVDSKTSHQYHRSYAILDYENDAGTRFVSPEKRRCWFRDENSLEVYRHYSYPACTVQCRKDAQLRMCNCTNFFMPNVPERLKCDVEGIICLNKHLNELSVQKAKWSSRAGLYCDCLPSCTEGDFWIVKDSKVTTAKDYSTVKLELSALPTERYRRNVVRGVLDLVVSTGGTGGLFFGASILSFVELLYFLLVRPFCDVYSRRFGARRLQDNRFAANPGWTYRGRRTSAPH